MSKDLTASIKQKVYDAGLLPLKSQAELWSNILKDKMDKVLPLAMKETGIDMWLIICRENCEDPLFKTIVTWDMPSARRLTILAYVYNKQEHKVKPLILGGPSPEMAKLYTNVKTPEEDVRDCLNRILAEYNPEKIGVNKSPLYGFCDGLTATLEDMINEKLGEDYKDRLASAEDLSLRWLQTVTDKELSIMEKLTEITHDIINLSFSKAIITVGTTTTTHIEWFMRDTILDMGFDFWFGPDIDLQRKGSKVSRMFNSVIEHGDLLHCDIGVCCRFIPLHTDVQRLAYVLMDNEKAVPDYIKNLLKTGNRLQDITTEAFRAGVKGNEVFTKAIEAAKAEGIEPMLYTHPLGTFGHGAGPTIGMYDNQAPVKGKGEKLLKNNTCYALELNIKMPIAQWDNQEVFAYLEEDIYFNEKVRYISGRQTEIIEV